MSRITLAYALGMAVLLLMVDFGALRDVATYVQNTFLLDKVIHFTMYGLLALLATASLLHRSPSRPFVVIATSASLVLILATLEELSNAFVAFRSYSATDLVANYLGILCLGVLPLLAWQRTLSQDVKLPRAA